MNAKWFEMDDRKKHIFNNKVWIPLYAQRTISETGDPLHEGFVEEYFGASSLIIQQNQQEAALNLEWMDLNSGSGHKPLVDDDNILYPADVYPLENSIGIHPVLVQEIEIDKHREIYIHQDIILGLGLRMEGDIWVCPEEDYAEVIKLTRDKDKRPVQVEIKAEFLKDYLCATSCGLILLTYQCRQAIQESFEDLQWDEEVKEKTAQYYWTGRFLPVREGRIFSQPVHVSHTWRTDTDYSEDIPVYGFPTDENTSSHSWTVEPEGRSLTRCMSEIWKIEWITPATNSPRVRNDEVESTLRFVVDNEGNKETSATLGNLPSRWLWFHPNVINDLLKKKAGMLYWHTENTGNVGGAWNRSVHFGVNSNGFINVFAKQ